ncbi:hypothetical protein J4E89_004432 [Alternaria sp. Ai002NY15]|nr:hypothetical protein J4E89_004432 [Alternaria sp. Ai002NY15]
MSLKTNVWILKLATNAEHLFNNYNIDLFIEYVEFVALGLPQTSPADLSPKCLQRCATTSAASTPHAHDDKFEMHPARSRTPVLHVQEQSLEDRYALPLATLIGKKYFVLHATNAMASQRILHLLRRLVPTATTSRPALMFGEIGHHLSVRRLRLLCYLPRPFLLLVNKRKEMFNDISPQAGFEEDLYAAMALSGTKAQVLEMHKELV